MVDLSYIGVITFYDVNSPSLEVLINHLVFGSDFIEADFFICFM